MNKDIILNEFFKEPTTKLQLRELSRKTGVCKIKIIRYKSESFRKTTKKKDKHSRRKLQRSKHRTKK